MLITVDILLARLKSELLLHGLERTGWKGFLGMVIEKQIVRGRWPALSGSREGIIIPRINDDAR